jgi:hypothetical protein
MPGFFFSLKQGFRDENSGDKDSGKRARWINFPGNKDSGDKDSGIENSGNEDSGGFVSERRRDQAAEHRQTGTGTAFRCK